MHIITVALAIVALFVNVIGIIGTSAVYMIPLAEPHPRELTMHFVHWLSAISILLLLLTIKKQL